MAWAFAYGTKDMFERTHIPSHLTLHPDVLKIKTIIVLKQKISKMPFVYYLQIHFWLLCSLEVLAKDGQIMDL